MNATTDNIMLLRGMIQSLPDAARQQCMDLAQRITQLVVQAGEPVGSLALAMVGVELTPEIAAQEAPPFIDAKIVPFNSNKNPQQNRNQ